MRGQGLLEDTAITLKVTEKELSGSAGCNLYFAKYGVGAMNSIQIKEVANTEMACGEPAGVMEQEVEYLRTFSRVTSYQNNGEELLLSDDQGDVLLDYRLLPKFEADPQGLTGKTWRLTSADKMRDDLGEFSLWFDKDTFRGTTSCRDYEGAYLIADDTISISMIKMISEADCSQEELLAEGTYTTLLGWIDQYNVTGERLELFTIQNDKMIFVSEIGE